MGMSGASLSKCRRSMQQNICSLQRRSAIDQSVSPVSEQIGCQDLQCDGYSSPGTQGYDKAMATGWGRLENPVLLSAGGPLHM